MDVLRVPIDVVPRWQWRALRWALNQENHASGFLAFFNNNTIAYPNDPFPNRLFVGQKRVVSFDHGQAFSALADAHRQQPSYLVGYLSYDVKNQLENLQSRNSDRLGFPEAYFAEPKWIIDFEDDCLSIQGEGDLEAILTALQAEDDQVLEDPSANVACLVQCRVTYDEYIRCVRQIQQYIQAGDVYELNYCIEFFAQHARLDPLFTYRMLNQRSAMPFSTFVKIGEQYIIGASPERFLKKQGRTILSQPIKGTIRRGQTPEEDEQLREQLKHSEKERAENLMIVDLVRNDLARSAETGSVRVDELFGIYGYQHVYQMISTVSATLREEILWASALQNAFPMGSMTGAPKVRAMELIDELEVSRRGVYSGTVGLITPNGDFDFNVVIRTLLYNAQRQYASFSVGSAITYDADPAQEWDECLLKARAIREVLENNQQSI